MDMILDPAYAKAFAIQVSRNCGEIRMKFWPNFTVDRWQTIICAEDDMNEQEHQGLRHEAIVARAFGPLVRIGYPTQAFGLG
jgi:hypothetical protein